VTGILFLIAALFMGVLIVPYHAELGIHLVVLSSVYLSWIRACCWGIPAALLVAGMVTLERTKGFTLPAVLVWLGEISYSLYLIQPLTIRLSAWTSHFFHLTSAVVIFCFFILLSISVGYLCWRFVEKPLTRTARTFLLASGMVEGS
jgi:peptidoglycan/LPS O-acetylase OafA/YrhL